MMLLFIVLCVLNIWMIDAATWRKRSRTIPSPALPHLSKGAHHDHDHRSIAERSHR